MRWNRAYTALSLGFAVLCWPLSPARATQAIDRPAATPDVLYLHESVTVTVSAQVAVDSAFLPTSVRLVQVRPHGAVKVLSPMYDDATHGDVLTRDGRYTAQVAFLSHTKAVQQLAVQAMYTGRATPVTSPVITLKVVKHPTETAIQSASDLAINSRNSFATLRATEGDKKARAAVIATLKHQTGVTGVRLGPDGFTVEATLSSGLSFVLLTSPTGTKGSGSLFAGCDGGSGVPSFPRAVQPTGNAAGLILAPFFSSFSPNDASNDVAFDLRRTCSSPNVLTDATATLDSFRTLGQYGAVHISTHGGVLPDGRVILATGDQVTVFNRITNLPDWLLGVIVPVGVPGSDELFWAVTPDFIAKYVHGMPGSIVFASACDTFGDAASGYNTSLASALLASGAQSFLGYQGSVNTSYDVQVGRTLWDVLTDPAAADADRTFGAAVDRITSTIGTVDPTAYDAAGHHAVLRSSGSRDAILNNNLVVNGSFESGDLGGWISDPDLGYDVASIDDRTDGSYSARLGRWDEPYVAGGGFRGPPVPGEEPGGADFIYQDLYLPPDASISTITLKFNYNVVTYDGADYDWFDAIVQDADTGEYLAMPASHIGGIIEGSPSNWGEYWTSGWTPVTQDLTPFKGRHIRLLFMVQQDGYGDQTAAYIDNVSVTCAH